MERIYILNDGKPYYIWNEKKYYGILKECLYRKHEFAGVILNTSKGECKLEFSHTTRVYVKTNALQHIWNKILTPLPEDVSIMISSYLYNGSL